MCDRQCVADEPPMTCYYNWTLERYLSMAKSCYRCPFNLEKCYNKDCIAGDGFKRVVKVINRQLPGPVIAVSNSTTPFNCC